MCGGVSHVKEWETCYVGGMANTQTIQDVDRRLEWWHRKLTRAVNEINDLRAKRKKMVKGQIKVPPPAGVKHKFEPALTTHEGPMSFNEFGDLIPSFGPGGPK